MVVWGGAKLLDTVDNASAEEKRRRREGRLQFAPARPRRAVRGAAPPADNVEWVLTKAEWEQEGGWAAALPQPRDTFRVEY